MRRRNAKCGPLLSWEQSARAGARIRELRTAAGLLQYDIAHAAGVSTQLVSELERGRHRWLAATREGARLREAIDAAGLTQKAVAARLGVNEPWLQFRLKAKTLLTAAEVERIEQAIKDQGDA